MGEFSVRIWDASTRGRVSQTHRMIDSFSHLRQKTLTLF